MTWTGKPRWNGNVVDLDLNGCLFAFNENLGPICVLLDYCDDYFIPVFKTKDNLERHICHLKSKGMSISSYQIKQIDDFVEFMDCMKEQNIRIMFEPVVINDNHTKWKEVIYKDEQWKFADGKLN